MNPNSIFNLQCVRSINTYVHYTVCNAREFPLIYSYIHAISDTLYNYI
jgi:hypothetical protein